MKIFVQWRITMTQQEIFTKVQTILADQLSVDADMIK